MRKDRSRIWPLVRGSARPGTAIPAKGICRFYYSGCRVGMQSVEAPKLVKKVFGKPLRKPALKTSCCGTARQVAKSFEKRSFCEWLGTATGLTQHLGRAVGSLPHFIPRQPARGRYPPDHYRKQNQRRRGPCYAWCMVLRKARQERRVRFARLSPTRRRYPAGFNAEVALVALLERRLLVELAVCSPLATTQITRWQQPTFSPPHPSAGHRIQR